MKEEIIVVGGGPAGMMAAIAAGRMGARVMLLEKKQNLGIKLRITGKGRCNITNSAPLSSMIEYFHNGKFLYGALSRFTNNDLQRFFQDRGLPLKIERGGRVFPQSDRAGDIVDILLRELQKCRVEVRRGSPIEALVTENGAVRGVKTAYSFYPARSVIMATGGASYPGTGSTGEGMRMAQQAGHNIITPRPALVPLETVEQWPSCLQGLSLKNVRVSVYINRELTAQEFGEMIFTHFGVSGPVILTLSCVLSEFFRKAKPPGISLSIDLKPALSPEKLDERILRDFKKFNNKQLKNALFDLLPKALVPVIIELSGIDPETPVHSVTRPQRLGLVSLLKDLRFTVSKTRPLSEAIVTAGGVDTKEINPRTMESKIVQGLYFAGEIIDYHGKTGGYNLQGAFSTGFLAGQSAAKKVLAYSMS